MNKLVVVCLLLGAFSQAWTFEMFFHNRGYTFVYHTTTNVLIAKNMYDCYFIETNAVLSKEISNSQRRIELENKILEKVHMKQDITKSSISSAILHFKDGSATTSCIGLNIYILQL